MQGIRRPSRLEYAAWLLLVVLMFLALVFAGRFGAFVLPASVQSRITLPLMQTTYILAMAVLSIFVGSLIWIVITFRERGEG